MNKQELAEELVRSAGGTPSISRHPAPDNDPYGWVAAVEEDRPTVASSTGEKLPVRPPHVVIWTPGFPDPDKFDNAVAKVLPNGTLLIMRWGSDCPLKGYATGAWLTFEHVGEEYHTKPQRVMPARGEVEQVRPAEYRKGGYVTSNLAQSLTDPLRRQPPTHEQDADDTQSLPKVAAKAEEGGGVAGPKARGARPDAGFDGHPGRPSTLDGSPDGVLPRWWQTLKIALRNPAPDED